MTEAIKEAESVFDEVFEKTNESLVDLKKDQEFFDAVKNSKSVFVLYEPFISILDIDEFADVSGNPSKLEEFKNSINILIGYCTQFENHGISCRRFNNFFINLKLLKKVVDKLKITV